MVLAVGSLFLLPFCLARIPADYFQANRRQRLPGRSWWLARLSKNLLGLCILGLGIIMLVLPGQGLLTIMVGLWLVDFPGKYRLERHIVCLPGALRAINHLRARAGQPPLRVGTGHSKPPCVP
ncbi:PGPGW domain-containing protein [Myxococcota bacterium]